MRLHEFILGNLEAILEEWVHFARTIQPASSQMSVEDLRDHAEEMLQTIAADIAQPQSQSASVRKAAGAGPHDDFISAAEHHATARLHSGFTIDLLVAEFRALRASVLRLWLDDTKLTDSERVSDIIRFNEAIDQAIAESVARFSSTVASAQDVFLGILGHDLRTPLQSIGSGAQFLMHGEKQSHLIQLGSRMYRSVLRMKGLLDNLLDFTHSRIGNGIHIDPHLCDLREVAEEVVNEFRLSHPDRQIISASTGDCRGEWDCLRISQVFQNLISNALQYSDPKSQITVRTEAKSDVVCLSVHNTGVPIPEVEQERLYTLFHRVMQHAHSDKPRLNLGLGLYISKEIISAHGGDIQVRSKEGEGTTFTASLPKQSRS